MLNQDLYYLMTLPLRIMRDLTFDVYVLSDKKKKIVYIVSTSVGKVPYYIERLCWNDATMTKIKRIYAWELKKFVNEQDAVFVDMHKYFVRFFDDGLIVPEFVRQVLDLDKPLNDAIKLKKSELNKANKFSYEISNDPEALKFFYDKMYIHLIRKYGDLAIDSFCNIEKIFKNGGELIFVTLNGERIAAGLNQIHDDTYFLRKNGILDNGFMKEGAMVAAYYFSILRAKELGAKMVDFGGSKPFLTDGVLRHKSLWGSRICMSERAKRMIYLKNVLFEQPFICIENGKLKAVVFSDYEKDKLEREYANSGLEFKVSSTFH